MSFTAVSKRAAVLERARAGEKYEHRRAEVRDPPGEEDGWGRPTGRLPGVAAHVVDGHQDHDEAADEIEGVDAFHHFASSRIFASCDDSAKALAASGTGSDASGSVIAQTE